METLPPVDVDARAVRDLLAAVVEGTRLYGQGAMDRKAGLAALVCAIEALDRAGVRLRGDLLVTAVADEVCGGHLGTVHGGTEFNLVADRAVLQIDRRTLPGEDPFFTTSGMDDESVDLPDVARGARVYARLVRDLLE